MTESNKPDENSAATVEEGLGLGTASPTDKRMLAMKRIYLKDCSYESPNSPRMFTSGKWDPKLNVKIGTSFFEIGEENYEVVLHVSVEARVDDEVAFLSELQQAGIFEMKGFTAEEREQLAGSFCPNILFPYAREAIGNLVAKGSFPQILLQPFNFDELYKQRQQEKSNSGSDEPIPGMPDIPGMTGV